MQTVNPAGRIAPGRFFYYNLFTATTDVTSVVSVSSDPDGEPDPIAHAGKVWIIGDENGDGVLECIHVTQRPGVSISIVNNVVPFSIPDAIVDKSEGATLITRVEYRPPRGEAGTEFNFQTEINGNLAFTESIEVLAQLTALTTGSGTADARHGSAGGFGVESSSAAHPSFQADKLTLVSVIRTTTRIWWQGS